MSRRTAVLLVAGAAVAVTAPLLSSIASAGPLAATYTPYATGVDVGEPSIGYDPKADAVVYGAGTTNVRMTWDDRVRPAKVTVVDASAPTSATSLDAITFTDQATSRTFVSQLVGACSLSSYSDDAGKTYTPIEGCGANTLLDHQSIGGGPYTKSKPLGAQATGYPDAVYYCAQNSFGGTCARSDDGGLTFGVGVPAYNVPVAGDPYGGACSAIHGHLRVGPDGTAYLPNKGCGGVPTTGNLTNSEFFGGVPALAVTEDDGVTWQVRKVNSGGAHNADESDPSVAADKGGLVYFGWEDGTNPTETTYGTSSAAKIAVTKDHGRTWSKPYDVSTPLGLSNVQFPEVIAGGPGRAAFAFLGTTARGDDQHNGFVGTDGKPAVWHLYISTTLDSGKSWSTVDTTPKDPVQRGCVDLQGTSNKTATDPNICDQRNLLDFNDITVDKTGRVLVAYADGCTGACVTNPSTPSTGSADMVMRQSSGPLLYAPAAPAPRATKATPPSTGTSGSSGTAGSSGSTGATGTAATAHASRGGVTTRSLASTGGRPLLAVGGVLLLGMALLLRRRTSRP